MRALADQSRQATGEVAAIIQDIQRGTNSAVMATEDGTKRVAEGAEQVQRAGETIERLAASIAAAALAAEQIAASSTQQAVATAQISDAMRSIDEVMEGNTTSARQAEEAALDLDRVANQLKALIGSASA